MNLLMPRLALTSLGFGIEFLILFLPLAFAASGDLYLSSENVWLSDSNLVHGEEVRMYATVSNDTENDLLGSVQFVDQGTGSQIGTDQPISVLARKTDTVFVDWAASAGTTTVQVTVIPWDTSEDDPSNNQVSFTVTVDYDYDGDGVGNAQDPNDDNDEAADTEDAFPYDATETQDTDGDGTGNNTDTDDDNDGILDAEDELPEDATETQDTDEDGTGNNTDTDDDNDGLSDEEETSAEDPTDPTDADTDGDGYSDGPGTDETNLETADTFPTDPEEWSDYDADGEGDNADTDDDNDNLSDEEDLYPQNAGPVVVMNQTIEETENGERTLVLDASQSYDPEGSPLVIQWWAEDGTLLGEEAILKLPINNTLLPSKLVILDEIGEARTLELNLLGTLEYIGTMGLALGVALGISLAILLYLKYSRNAPATENQKPPHSSSKRSKRLRKQ